MRHRGQASPVPIAESIQGFREPRPPLWARGFTIARDEFMQLFGCLCEATGVLCNQEVA